MPVTGGDRSALAGGVGGWLLTTLSLLVTMGLRNPRVFSV